MATRPFHTPEGSHRRSRTEAGRDSAAAPRGRNNSARLTPHRAHLVIQRLKNGWIVHCAGTRRVFSEKHVAVCSVVNDALTLHRQGLPAEIVYVDENGSEPVLHLEGRASAIRQRVQAP